jgi:hypothetical protein
MSSNRRRLGTRAVNVRPITVIAVALALAATPVAFGADPPEGSHGQETDMPRAAHVSLACTDGSRTVVVLAAPSGSHGQETDQPKRSPVILRAACISRSSAVPPTRPTTLNATAPKGSHGQETDQPGA